MTKTDRKLVWLDGLKRVKRRVGQAGFAARFARGSRCVARVRWAVVQVSGASATFSTAPDTTLAVGVPCQAEPSGCRARGAGELALTAGMADRLLWLVRPVRIARRAGADRRHGRPDASAEPDASLGGGTVGAAGTCVCVTA
jgi:hypothetical protein